MQPFAISQTLYNLLMEGEKQVVKAGHRFQPSKQYPSLSLIGSGYIKRYLISPENTISIQSIYGPGDIFPLTPIFRLVFNQDIYEGPTKYHYGVMTDAEIYSIDNKTFLNHINDDPTLYKDLLAQSGRRLQSNIQQLENAGLKKPYRRVAHQLAFLARQFGTISHDGVRIPLPLSAQDLADSLNLDVKDTKASLKLLYEQGLIQGKDIMTVLDLEALVNEAYS